MVYKQDAWAYSRVMADDDGRRTKRCVICGGAYLLEFFQRGRNANGSRDPKVGTRHYRDHCMGCEAIRKRAEPVEQRLRKKAVAARRRHGAKLKELGVIKNEGDLEEIYGWALDRMLDDIKRISEKGCPYCLQLIKMREHGLGTITVDILNANEPPHYSTNVIWCCAGCNSKKQLTPPNVWGARQSMWKLWRDNQIRLGVDPEAFGFLPLDKKEDPQHSLW